MLRLEIYNFQKKELPKIEDIDDEINPDTLIASADKPESSDIKFETPKVPDVDKGNLEDNTETQA